MNNYNNAFTEVYEILKYLDEEELNKIPYEVVKAIKENRNIDYEYIVDEEVDLRNRDMLIETKAILFNLFRDYLSTPEQKEKILKMQQEERLRNEEKKKELYSLDVFANKKHVEKITENNSKREEQEIDIYKESFINKVWNYIKEFFKIK